MRRRIKGMHKKKWNEYCKLRAGFVFSLVFDLYLEFFQEVRVFFRDYIVYVPS